MDNISHSFVSLAAGELLHRSLPRETNDARQSLRRKLLLITAAIAGNLPDLDMILSPTLRRPLGYLLHHRGHSHTFVFEIPQALVMFLITWLCWSSVRALLRESHPAQIGYILALVAGFVSHIAMDYLNSYGVHPFYPFDAHWIFGDLVFILEPLFWVAFGVPVALLSRRWWVRYPLLLVVLALPVFGASRDYLPWISCAVLFLIAGTLGFLQIRDDHISGRRALISAFAVLFVFVIVQAFASHAARERVSALIHANASSSSLLDVAMNAAPFNPLCWSFISIEENSSDGRYRLRTGMVSIAPSVMAAGECPSIFGRVNGNTLIGHGAIQTSEVSASIEALRDLNKQNCFVAAWLRFARMPYVTETQADDLRFSHGGRGNFSSLYLKDFDGVACPTGVPPWIPPREDLLGN